MLESQTLEIQRIELRKQINALGEQIETRAEEPETETRIAERLSLFKEMAGVDDKMIGALRKEDAEEAQAAMAQERGYLRLDCGTSGMARELGQRTSMVKYMAGTGRSKSGWPLALREHEYNDHVFGGSFAPRRVPRLNMFLDRGEKFSMEAWQGR